MKQPPITVFTKPWQSLTLEQLADLTPETIEAYSIAGVPLLRTMLKLEPGLGYFENVEAFGASSANQ